MVNWTCLLHCFSFVKWFVVLLQNKLGILNILMTHHLSTIADIENERSVRDQAFSSINVAIEIFKRVITISYRLLYSHVHDTNCCLTLNICGFFVLFCFLFFFLLPRHFIVLVFWNAKLFLMSNHPLFCSLSP